MAVHCPECGFVNAEGANYCQKCGAYLSRPEGGDEPTTMTYTVDESGEMQPVDVDEMVDRAGAAVVWHFELLPRWALAALAVRELLTLVLAQIALRRGQPLEINWFGRIAVFPVMGAIFWAMVFPGVVWDALLIAGLVLAVLATIAYVRDGLRQRR